MALAQKQQEILINLLLGDGSLEFNGYRGTRFQAKQEETKREYVYWLRNQFTNVVRTPPRQRPDTRQWCLELDIFLSLSNFGKSFYKDRKK